MKSTIFAVALLLTVALVIYARKKDQENSLKPKPVQPPADPYPGDQLNNPPPPLPRWLNIKTTPLLDLEMVLEWFQANKSQLEGAPQTVVGFVLRINTDPHSETAQLVNDLLPEVKLAPGDILIGFYDRKTKKIQKDFTLVLYKVERIAADLGEQFGKKDLLIIE
jgi:hypothetical protein